MVGYRNGMRVFDTDLDAIHLGVGGVGVLSGCQCSVSGLVYQVKIDIVGTNAGAQTNYPVKLTVIKGTGSNTPGVIYLNNGAGNWPYDIRFFASDNSTPLSFWRESDDGTTQYVWIKIPSLPASPTTTTIYMHYGDYSVDASDGNGTFPFFDDCTQPVTVNSVLVQEPTNPNRVADQSWEGGYIMEQSDFKIAENSYISWFRGGIGTVGNTGIGYATSTDGIHWTPYAGNPVLGSPYCLPYVVDVSGHYYMFCKNVSDGNIYLFDLADHLNPAIMNGGNPVFTHSSTTTDWWYEVFNVGVTVVGTTWHMFIEARPQGGTFGIGYAYSTLALMNWNTNKSASRVILTAGNPSLYYVPERNALLSLHGDISGAYWVTAAHYASLTSDLTLAASWIAVPQSTFVISHTSMHICDPSIMYPYNTSYGIMIACSWAQASIGEWYYPGTLLQLYDQLLAGAKWTGDTSYLTYSNGVMKLSRTATWAYLYSNFATTMNMALRTRAQFIGYTTSLGSMLGFARADLVHYIDILYFNGPASLVIRAFDGGSTSYVSNQDANWNIYEILYRNAHVDFMKNNVAMTNSPITTTVPTDANRVRFQSQGGDSYAVNFDWVVVRPYVNPEPTYGTAYSATQYSTPAVVYTAGYVKTRNGVRTIVAGGINLTSYQDATYPKKGVVYVDDTDGIVKFVVGDPVTPSPPNTTGRYTLQPIPPDFSGSSNLGIDDVVLAEVWVSITGTIPASTDVTDRRLLLGPAFFVMVKTTSGAPDDATYGNIPGTLVFNSNENKFYIRGTSAWKYAVMT